MQFSCRRGWLRFIFSYIFFLIGENFESPYSATIHQLVCGFDILAQVYGRDGLLFEGRFHGFLASLFTQTGSTGTWNFFRSETLGREEIWVTFEFDFESRSHILIAEFGIEFKRWHESKIDLTIISKFSTKCINIARSSWDQVERESDELRYSLIVFWLKFFFKYIYDLISTNSKEGIMKRPFYKEGNEIRKGVSSW